MKFVSINKKGSRKVFVAIIAAFGMVFWLFKYQCCVGVPSAPRVLPSKDEMLNLNLTIDWSFVSARSKLTYCKLDSADGLLRFNDSQYLLDQPKLLDLKRQILESIYSDIPQGPVDVNGGRPQYITIYFGDWPFGVSKIGQPKYYYLAVVPIKKLLKELAVDVSESVD